MLWAPKLVPMLGAKMGHTWVPEITFMSQPFGAHRAGMRVPILLWCGSLGVVSAGAMGGACSALDIFKASWVRIHGLGSHAFHCCSRLSGLRYWWAACCGVAPGPVGKEGGGCGDPSFFLVLFSNMAILHVTVRTPAFSVTFSVLKMRTTKFMELRSSQVSMRF